MVLLNKFILLFLLCATSYAQEINVHVYGKLDKSSFQYKFFASVIDIYNRKSVEKIYPNYIETSKFSELFSEMKQERNINQKCALGAITITSKRQQIFDFSKYIPLQNTLLVLKGSNITKSNWNNSNFRIGYFKGTSQETLIDNLVSKYNVKPVGIPFSNSEDVEQQLIQSTFDMMFVEGVDFSSLKHATNLLVYYDENYNYGVMYPKGSELKQKLQPYIDYYIRSTSYFNLLRDTFGKNVGNRLFQFFYKKKQN